MLDTYLQRTQLLLGDQTFETFNEPDLVTYINIGRGQIAGAAECVRVYVTLAVTAASQQYAFSSITLGSYSTSVQGVLNVRQIAYSVGDGQKPLYARPFPYFQQFVLGTAVPQAGPPKIWSQFGQGALGTLFFNKLDAAYTLSLDAVAYPIDLTDDSTPEALPYQWTDAVPFFAAYYALMAVDPERSAMMYREYEKFEARARAQTTPAVLPGNAAQSTDPFMPNRLGMQSKAGP